MRSIAIRYLSAIATVGLLVSIGGQKMWGQSMQLQKATTSSAGGASTNGQTAGYFTVGQAVTGQSSNGTHKGTFGFWETSGKVASVSTGIMAEAGPLSVVPNPASATPEISFEPKESGTAELNIYSSDGSVLMTRELRVTSGLRTTLEISTNDLPAGSYVVRVTLGGSASYHPLILAR